ncbi:MAG: 2-hydroxyacid dehydrogenase [Solirubrobacteraceae bacterium]
MVEEARVTQFRIGVTRDLRADNGGLAIDVGLDQIAFSETISWSFLPDHGAVLTGAQLAEFDGVFVWGAAIDAATVSDPGRLVHIGRLGVGLDAVDVDACTKSGVLVTVTPDAVRRPVASGAVALLLALSHRVVGLDRAVRRGQWQADGAGTALSQRVLGIVGLGNIGSELVRLVAPWGMNVVAADPFPPPDPPPGVTLVALDDLLQVADFVVITCPLTETTLHLIDASMLAMMKPTAYLVNVARGAIVETDALVTALATGQIAGAALDVLEQEPPPGGHPLLGLENVIVLPHAVAATDEFHFGLGTSAITSARAVAAGRVPGNLVNPEALSHPRLAGRFQGVA